MVVHFFHTIDYIELVDWTGRQIRPDKRGAIGAAAPEILTRLGIPTHCWLHNCQQLETDFHQVIGSISSLQQFCKKLGQVRPRRLPTKFWLSTFPSI